MRFAFAKRIGSDWKRFLRHSEHVANPLQVTFSDDLTSTSDHLKVVFLVKCFIKSVSQLFGAAKFVIAKCLSIEIIIFQPVNFAVFRNRLILPEILEEYIPAKVYPTYILRYIMFTDIIVHICT